MRNIRERMKNSVISTVHAFCSLLGSMVTVGNRIMGNVVLWVMLTFHMKLKFQHSLQMFLKWLIFYYKNSVCIFRTFYIHTNRHICLFLFPYAPRLDLFDKKCSKNNNIGIDIDLFLFFKIFEKYISVMEKLKLIELLQFSASPDPSEIIQKQYNDLLLKKHLILAYYYVESSCATSYFCFLWKPCCIRILWWTKFNHIYICIRIFLQHNKILLCHFWSI